MSEALIPLDDYYRLVRFDDERQREETYRAAAEELLESRKGNPEPATRPPLPKTEESRVSNMLTRTALGVTAAVCLLAAPGAYAQFKSLDITAPGGPGSGLDQTARAIEDALRKDGLVPNVKVVNVPGGGGMIAVSQFLTTKKRDPQAVIATGAGAVFFPITNKTPVSVADITPVARLAGEYEVMVVRADSDIKTLEDLIAKFKANPGSVAWGGGSPGSTENIFFARIAKAVGVDLKRLNFISHPNTGEVVVSALSGQVAVAGGGWQDFETQVQAGKLRAIAVASPERIEGIDAPTLKEKGIDIVFSNWRGVSVHPSLTKEEVAAVGDLFAKLVKSPRWQQIIKDRGWRDLYLPADQYATFIKEEAAGATEILKELGLAK